MCLSAGIENILDFRYIKLLSADASGSVELNSPAHFRSVILFWEESFSSFSPEPLCKNKKIHISMDNVLSF